MADEIVLKTFAASTIAPVDDAVIQEVYTGDGGIISGATVTIKDANTLHITGGYGAICGREFQIFASDIPVVLSSSGNLNGRLYIHMDLSQSTNPIQLLTEVAASLTPCVQDADVNLTNGIFEINLATFTVGTSAISGLADVAPKLVGIESSDLTSIKAVGSTNATGSTITKGTYFYLNGKLCLAKSDIANGATFTLNTNYEVVTAGGLNSLNSALTDVKDVSSDIVLPATSGTSWGITAKIKNGWFSMCIPYFMPARTGDNQTIATGLPKALCQMQGMVGGANAGNTAVIIGAGTGVWINAGGTSLMGHIGANSASRAHWIYIQYQIDES